MTSAFITSTQAAADEAKGARFAFFRVQNLDASKLSNWLHQNRKELNDKIKSEIEERNSAFAAYAAFFGRSNAWFPLAPQLANARKGGLPKKFPILEFLLGMELSTGFLIGAHDLTKAKLPLLLDVASGGESYESLMKQKVMVCSSKELIISDGRGVIASVVQGPDFRTAVQPLGHGEKFYADQLWSIMGVPGIDSTYFSSIETMLEKALKEVCTSCERVSLTL